MKFNLNDYKDYKGNYAMHCKTKEEAESFCRFLDLSGRSWFDGDSYLEVDKWDRYKIDTIYYFNRGTYGSVKHIRRSENFVILEWSDFMENKETVSEFTLGDLKSGDFVKFEDGSVCCILFVVDRETHKNVAIEYSTGTIRYMNLSYDDSGFFARGYGHITEIRRPTQLFEVGYNIFDDGKGCLHYAREEEMTLDEVCKALGRKIKIVE